VRCGRLCLDLYTFVIPILEYTINCCWTFREGAAQVLRISRRICIGVSRNMQAIKPIRVSVLFVECYKPTRTGIQKSDIVRYVFLVCCHALIIDSYPGDEYTGGCDSHVSVSLLRQIYLMLCVVTCQKSRPSGFSKFCATGCCLAITGVLCLQRRCSHPLTHT